MAYVDERECYRFVNQKYTELLKLPATEIVGKHVRDLFDSATYERRQKYIKAALAGEKVYFEDAYLQQVEQYYWAITLIPHQQEKNRVKTDPKNSNSSGYFVFDQNITERKLLEEKLLQHQQFLDTIIENIPLALFAKDVTEDFRYLLWNKASEKIFKISREQAIRHNVYDLHSREKADFLQSNDLEAVAQGKLIEINEEPLDTDLQGKILLRTLKLPLFDKHGNATHLLGISEDITERKQREKALQLIVEGTASKTGDEFFRPLVRYLAEVLRVRYAWVTESANEAKTKVRILAFWQGEDFYDNFEYDLAGTPCENILQGRTCYYSDNVQALFFTSQK